MKTLVILCVLVVVVTCQPAGDASRLTNFLAGARAKFRDMVKNNKGNVINQGLKDLGSALRMAKGLIMNNAITLERGADLILNEFRYFMRAGPLVPSIEHFNQGVCTSNQFPFPKNLATFFPDLTSELNSRVPDLCDSLGYNSAE